MASKMVLLRQRLVFLRRRLMNFTDRALRGLRFFPFTLLYVVFNAVISVIQLRRGHLVICRGEIRGKASAFLPRNVMLWLDRVLTGPTGYQYHVCLRLPRATGDANLHDVFSVLLASPRMRSVGFYWDWSSLADDVSLLRVKGRNNPTVSATSSEDLGFIGFKQFEEFFHGNHVGIVLPVSATRDAQTFLKRQAGRAHAVCLNLSENLRSLAEAVVVVHPEVRFFDLTPASPLTHRTANSQSLFDHGLSLQERMALVQASDVYVGSFDELGCTALFSKRPAVLLGGATVEELHPLTHGDMALWFPDTIEPAVLTKKVLQFLSRQLFCKEN